MANRYVFPLPDWRGLIGLHHGTDPGAADLMAPSGTPIRSMVDGTVTSVGTTGPGGNNVTIHGADGLDYYYAHMRDLPLVQQGQAVLAGAGLGVVGETGNAAGTGPHLHLGIGHGIAEGVDAHGGAGNGFDAVSFLRKILAGAVDVLNPGAGTPPAAPGGGVRFDPGGLVPAGFWTRGVAVVVGGALLVGGLTYALLSSDTGQATVRVAARGAKKAAVGAATGGVGAAVA